MNTRLDAPDARPRVQRIGTTLLIAAAICCAGLLITGVVLTFEYRPATAFGRTDDTWSVPQLVRGVHRVLSYALMSISTAGLVVAVRSTTVGRDGRTTRRRIATAIAVIATAGAAIVTGLLLPWDELELWAVTVGTNMDGYRPILDDAHNAIRSVVQGSRRVGPDTIERWFWTHLVLGALGVCLVSTSIIEWWRCSQRRQRVTRGG